MTYLVDSDWVADALAGRPRAVELLTALSAQSIAISLITYGEIFEGIYYGRDPATAEAVFRKFLREVDVLPLNRRIMQRFARIRGQLRRSGRVIGDPDLLIAATTLEHNLILVTRNLRDFSRVPDLKLYQRCWPPHLRGRLPNSEVFHSTPRSRHRQDAGGRRAAGRRRPAAMGRARGGSRRGPTLEYRWLSTPQALIPVLRRRPSRRPSMYPASSGLWLPAALM
ncbi:MAG: type II toxin-antitoxin system VapC family toxin [Chloroflexi bacterium]|nr:type II toxin-antitoxin system VapC family toxin [Chloroflexota bacterium]